MEETVQLHRKTAPEDRTLSRVLVKSKHRRSSITNTSTEDPQYLALWQRIPLSMKGQSSSRKRNQRRSSDALINDLLYSSVTSFNTENGSEHDAASVEI